MIHADLNECVVGQGDVGRAEGETFNHKPSKNPCGPRQFNINTHSVLSWLKQNGTFLVVQWLRI